jgi:hypothetical protein
MILLATHGDENREQRSRDWWLPPGFRIGTAKRNVLVAIVYLLALLIGLDALRGLLS